MTMEFVEKSHRIILTLQCQSVVHNFTRFTVFHSNLSNDEHKDSSTNRNHPYCIENQDSECIFDNCHSLNKQNCKLS
jgi:hypothetical protein